jgi:hypothetical protein
MGVIINHWPVAGSGYADVGYRWAFGLILALQAITWVWLALGRNQTPRKQSNC